MSSEKFITDEWHIWKDNSTIPFVFDKNGYAVACMCGKLHYNTRVVGCIEDYLFPDEVLANAHLIAAAPEMYRMLKYLADGIRFGDLQHTDRSLAAEIENLLKKARGEEWQN